MASQMRYCPFLRESVGMTVSKGSGCSRSSFRSAVKLYFKNNCSSLLESWWKGGSMSSREGASNTDCPPCKKSPAKEYVALFLPGPIAMTGANRLIKTYTPCMSSVRVALYRFTQICSSS